MKIAVLTSGGDSPGMNAAIRTVSVAGIGRGHEVIGIKHGYAGLLRGDTVKLDGAAVDGITRLGGTILGSSRCPEMMTPEGQARAKAKLIEMNVDALVVVGGNGSLTGAHVLAQGSPYKVVGLPASIDNDIGHTGLAIGVDTAVNTIVEACDRIADTARAHRRVFIVEVMGRKCGFLAMRAGIAAEADAILFGEENPEEEALVERLRAVLRKCFGPGSSKHRALIVKSEGLNLPPGRLTARLSEHLAEDAPGADLRETVLGHVVRGGNPTALDRVIAQRLAYGAVTCAEMGVSDVMLAWEPNFPVGKRSPDPSVYIVPIGDVLNETAKMLDSSSEIVKSRLALLSKVQDLFAI
ncbi:MAG: 6-phosphofructokinase [Polyangiaceae bacterium]|nr:6-phosphofructokinase [Polyangiaceae bacterium]